MFPKSDKTPRSPTHQNPALGRTRSETRKGSNSDYSDLIDVFPENQNQNVLKTSDKQTNSAGNTKPQTLPTPQGPFEKSEPIQPTNNQSIRKAPTPPTTPEPQPELTKKQVTKPEPIQLINNQIIRKVPTPPITPKPQPKLTENQVTMNQQQIQQIISSSVPEFSGSNQATRSNDLIRFTATADSIYQTLGTEEEFAIFNRLIKLRLTGEAFTRISHRNVKDYPELRDILKSMYSQTNSLEELERNYLNTQQSYGETIRNYGYRLLEAMEQYKTGYKAKYSVKEIEKSYKSHLESNLIQVFKRGLNNRILKEKVVTSTAENIDDIINETELIEGMLITTTNTLTPYNPTQHFALSYPTQQQQIIHNQITCNYCQRPNHTWDVCRTRMNQERAKKIAAQAQMNRRYQPPTTYHNSARPETNNRQYHVPTQQNQQHYGPHRKNIPQNNYTPAHYTQANRYQPKFCSHCKTTTGHTFDECRSKFFKRPNTQNNPPTDTRELTEKFNNMRINMIYPQSGQNPGSPEQHMHQGNANRSDQ